MTGSVKTLIPYLIVLIQIATVLLIAGLIIKKSYHPKILQFANKHLVVIGLLLSLGAVLGSLFYSTVLGYEPCDLCWWQRVALFPIPLIFLVSWVKKNRTAFDFILPLASIDLVLAAYNSYLQWGGDPLIPCSTAVSCTKLYVYEFGYITIPTMSITVAVALIVLWLIKQSYENRNA